MKLRAKGPLERLMAVRPLSKRTWRVHIKALAHDLRTHVLKRHAAKLSTMSDAPRWVHNFLQSHVLRQEGGHPTRVTPYAAVEHLRTPHNHVRIGRAATKTAEGQNTQRHRLRHRFAQIMNCETDRSVAGRAPPAQFPSRGVLPRRPAASTHVLCRSSRILAGIKYRRHPARGRIPWGGSPACRNGCKTGAKRKRPGM